METWPEVKLGSHVDLLTGFPFKSKEYSDDPKDVFLLRGDNCGQAFLRWEKAKRWPASDYENFGKYHLKLDDVVLAMDRPWISAGLKYSWIKDSDLPALLVQRVARMRGCNGLMTNYLRAIIGSKAFTDHVLAITTGVNVPHISGGDIKDDTFRLPPLPTQKRIAGVLSAYDDLIAINTRRIETLEEMARRTYEEWFPVPEGDDFPTSKVLDLGEVRTGKTPSKKRDEYWGEGIPFLKLPDMHGKVFIEATTESLTNEGAQSQRKKLIPPRSVSVSCIGTAGIVTINSIPLHTNQQINTIILKSPKTFPYVYFLLKSLKATILSYGATGATMANLSKGKLENIEFASFPNEKIKQFCDKTMPHFDLIENLQRQNSNLRAQRDLLLPRLISGEIDVSDAPLPVLEAAQ